MSYISSATSLFVAAVFIALLLGVCCGAWCHWQYTWHLVYRQWHHRWYTNGIPYQCSQTCRICRITAPHPHAAEHMEQSARRCSQSNAAITANVTKAILILPYILIFCIINHSFRRNTPDPEFTLLMSLYLIINFEANISSGVWVPAAAFGLTVK